MEGREKNGDWKPGFCPNPLGRPKTPEDLKEIKKFTKQEIDRCLNDCLQLTADELRKIKEDPQSTMLQLFVISVIANGIKKGDHQRLSFLLDRLIGKSKEYIDITTNNESIRPQIVLAEICKDQDSYNELLELDAKITKFFPVSK